jgi:hypothetical protein
MIPCCAKTHSRLKNDKEPEHKQPNNVASHFELIDTMKTLSVLFSCLAVQVITTVSGAETEEERLEAYHARNYTWPITEFQPNNPGWNRLMAHRLRQAEEIEGRSERFEAYAQTLSAAMIQPNFSEYGFGLARAPDDLMEVLRQGIRDGLAAGPSLEKEIPAIVGERPWWIDRPDLTHRVRNAIVG